MPEAFSRDEKIMTVKEAAELLKVSAQTIKNYIYQGKLKSFKTPGGHHRILESELYSHLETLVGANGIHIYSEEESIEQKSLKELKETYMLTIKALMRASEGGYIQPYVGHSERVANYSKMILEKMNLTPEEKLVIEKAALLHDVGKVGIRENILCKPEKLNDEEYEIIKQHPVIGEAIVKEIEYLQNTAPIIRHHHERFDGRGYPDGLGGNEIPMGARIIAVAEAYDIINAKLSDSPFRMEKSILELNRMAGSQFFPDLVDLFVEIIENQAKNQ